MRVFSWRHGRPGPRPGAGAVWLGIAMLLAATWAVAAAPRPAPVPAPPPDEEAAAPLPPFLRGVDLDQPSQEAFKGWPGKELRLRPYWLPWSGLSFQRARLFDRPIFLLMTVPWNRNAQRLQSETLSDPRVLTVLNSAWTTVLVDADRRPDIRERYQTGAWPVVAFLLPNGNPMLSQVNEQVKAQPITTTFVDPDTMLFLLDQGRIYYDKWKNVLQGVGQVWAESEGGFEPEAGDADKATTDEFARWMMAGADRQDGGFGAAPKFVLAGLTEYGALRDARLLPGVAEHARLTLEKTIASPLYDSRDGGVHRIATAPGWKGINYEKMLDKNAHLIRELVFALRLGHDDALEHALKETASFVTRVLARPGGGFYVAQVADPSSPDGGAYWNTPGEDGKAPPVDRLVLSGANATAGAALLRAAAWLHDDTLAAAGRGALDLCLERAYQPGRGVDHVIEPAPDHRRFLESQADVALALLDAYESTGDARYLAAGKDIVDFALLNLKASDESTLADHMPEPVELGILSNPRRPMADNVHLARAMVRLALHGEGESYREQARAIVQAYAGSLNGYGIHGIEGALAIEELIRDPLVVRIAGSGGAAAVAVRQAALDLPHGWVVVETDPAATGQAVATLQWRGTITTVDTPEALEREVRRLAELEVPEAGR